MATDAYAPQKRYVERQKSQGFTSLTVWVPEKDRQDIIELAAKRRQQHIAKQEAQRA